MKHAFMAGLAAMIGLSMMSAPAPAQQRQPRPPQSKKESDSKPALAVINNPTPSYLSGEASVTVRGDENPIIRLQMVPNGQALVEFPAKDRIFKVNPADPDLVTIEDSPTKETDRYILLRSSKQFLPGTPSSQSPPAATSMIVQMTSGMVISLLIHPTREFYQTVHRCVVMYDRDAIVKARQAAGLGVNLDQRDDNFIAKPPASLQMTTTTFHDWLRLWRHAPRSITHLCEQIDARYGIPRPASSPGYSFSNSPCRYQDAGDASSSFRIELSLMPATRWPIFHFTHPEIKGKRL